MEELGPSIISFPASAVDNPLPAFFLGKVEPKISKDLAWEMVLIDLLGPTNLGTGLTDVEYGSYFSQNETSNNLKQYKIH